MACKFDLNISITVFLLVACTILPTRAQDGIFHITKYGAKLNADATARKLICFAGECLEREACASTTPAKVVVRKGTFTLGIIKLDGPCKAPIELNVEGTLQSPSDLEAFKGADGWLVFGKDRSFHNVR
ncbi:hypothetical protein QQ045_017261 [Rhodiola kirilowii]